jgi:hypothetical protein
MTMKRIYLILIVLVGISVSCTKNFEDWQKDTKNASEVPGEMLFTNAQKALADQVAETSVNLNNFKLWAQFWTETTYTDEANYDLINRNIPNSVFRVLYRDVLRDLREAKALISATAVTAIEEDAKTNKLQMIEVLEVYTFQRLVDIFGNVPYSQALDIDATLNPAYDDGMTIYKDLVARLDAAMAAMKTGAESYGHADLYYGGDVAAWKTFAQSLKFRMAVTIADADNALAKGWAEAAAASTFSSAAESAILVYSDAPLGNTNPLYQALVASGRNDYVAANTIIDVMNDLEDPRRDVYFDKHGMDEYVGGEYGYTSAYADFAHVGAAMHEPTFPATIMNYVEIEFLKAEAAARGWSVGGTAVEHYNNAITASFDLWGVAGAADYLAKPEVAWDGSGDWKKVIGLQAWLGLYERGFEAWTTYRRLDWPEMNVPENALTSDTKTPRRFTFPVNEQTLNAANYYQAADAVGGDDMTTKLFWDKF